MWWKRKSQLSDKQKEGNSPSEGSDDPKRRFFLKKTLWGDADLMGLLFAAKKASAFQNIFFSNNTGQNAGLALAAAPGTDTTANGVSCLLTAGEALVFGDVCYLKSDGKLGKADADSVSTAPVVAMALASISNDATGNFLLYGVVRNDA